MKGGFVLKKIAGYISLLLVLCMAASAFSGCGSEEKNEFNGVHPVVTMVVKDYGTITVELYPEYAPNTVRNFISLANSGFYDGLTFHRVMKGFMIQGGCPVGTGMGGPGYSIPGEFSANGYDKNTLKHERGVISMARNSINMDSAGSQFFIMHANNSDLDGQYAAFGMVKEGMDVVDAIANCEVDASNPYSPKPITPVIIEKITVDTKGVEIGEVEKA